MVHQGLHLPFTLITKGAFVFLCILLFTSCEKKNNDSNMGDIDAAPDYLTAMKLYNDNNVDSAIVSFKKLTKELPNNPDAQAWYAEASRRLKNMDSAYEAAMKALELDPCHSFAHTVLADTYNPQYSMWEKVSSDSTMLHLRKAVECNPDEGNAWLSLCVASMHQKDMKLEQQSLSRLYELRFFTEPVMEMNRWMLKGLPENAFFLVNGDLDTYPAMILQTQENLRTDVAVVNISLLNMWWYVEKVCAEYNLPMPVTQDEMKSLRPYYDEDSTLVLPSMQILKRWIDMGEAFGRPFTASATCFKNALDVVIPDRILMGAYFAPGDASDGVRINPVAVETSLGSLNGKHFTGPMFATQDKSAVRRATPVDFAASMPYQGGLQCIEYLINNKQTDKARTLIASLHAFATDAAMTEKNLEKLKELEGKIEM